MNDTAAAAPQRPARAGGRNRLVREIVSWAIPVAALALGFGYRCVREPIFVEGTLPAIGQAKVGQILSLGVFPRPEGNRAVHIDKVRLAGATNGLQLADAVALRLNFKDPKGARPVLSAVGPPADASKVQSVTFSGKSGWYIVLELKAAKPGRYTATGVDLTYRSGVQRGTHHMKVNLTAQFQP